MTWGRLGDTALMEKVTPCVCVCVIFVLRPLVRKEEVVLKMALVGLIEGSRWDQDPKCQTECPQ